MESNDGEDGTRFVSRRNALKTLGAGAASLAAIGPASGRPDASEKNGRPSASVSSDSCESITVSRNTTGPNKPVTFTASSKSEQQSHDVGRGETTTFEAEAGEWSIESSHPAVVVEPSSVTVEQCAPPEPESATLTLTSPRCGVLAVERNDAGPESVLLFLHIDEDGEEGTRLYETASMRGARKEYDFGFDATISADIEAGSETGPDEIPADEIEIIGSPITVKPCE